jgi:transposase-like protein
MVNSNRTKLKGKIEVDESYIDAEAVGKYGRSKDNKELVVIAVELDEKKKRGRVRIELVNDATKESLLGFVKRNVEQNSEVITDAWNGYSGLEKENYKHTVSNQKQAKNKEEMLPHVHLIIYLLKRWLMGHIKVLLNQNICKRILMSMFSVLIGENLLKEDCYFAGSWKKCYDCSTYDL